MKGKEWGLALVVGWATALLMFWPSLGKLGGMENAVPWQIYESFFHTANPEQLLGDGADPLGSFWIVGFVQDILFGPETAKTPLLYAPLGLDLGLHEGYAWLDTLFAMPLRALIGSPGFYNAHVFTTLMFGVVVCTLLFRQLVSFPIALLMGYLLVCNEFVYQEIAFGRPTQVNWYCSALFMLCVVKLLKAPEKWWFAALGGLAFGGCCLTYWFGAAGLGFVLLLVMLYEHIRKGKVKLGVRNAAVMMVGVLVVILPVAGRLIWPIVQGEANGAYEPMLNFRADEYHFLGMSFPIYSTEPILSWADSKRFVLGRHYPLWLLAMTLITVPILLFKRWWSAVIVVLVAVLIPVGASLTIKGVVIPGPFAVIEWIFPPLVRCNFPDRLMLTPLLIIPLALLLCIGPSLDSWVLQQRKKFVALASCIAIGNLYVVWNSHEPAVTEMKVNQALIEVTSKSPGALIEFPFTMGNETYVQTEFHHQPVLTGPGMMMIHPARHKRYLKRKEFFQTLELVNQKGYRPSIKISDIDRLELYKDGFRHIVLYTEALQRPPHHFERLLKTQGEAFVDDGVYIIPLELP
jgi:hypothetical protein